MAQKSIFDIPMTRSTKEFLKTHNVMAQKEIYLIHLLLAHLAHINCWKKFPTGCPLYGKSLNFTSAVLVNPKFCRDFSRLKRSITTL